MEEKVYKMSIEPGILKLLGPNLYTNIYYVLSELIANAYDAEAHNVFIIIEKDKIIVEDDGHGMSYYGGEITKYLSVAQESRHDTVDSITPRLRRNRMGRKGVGKLAALSVSENVWVMTIHDQERSGFIMSRNQTGYELPAISDKDISFKKVMGNGTAIVMVNPDYRLSDNDDIVAKNLVKLFPLINDDFVIHIVRDKSDRTIQDVSKEVANQLCAIISLGNQFSYMVNSVPDYFENKPETREQLVKNESEFSQKVVLKNNNGEVKDYTLRIYGWIGAYKSVRGRKVDVQEFPDNYLSLYANKKMGEFNILPKVSQNKLNEVYVVGQLFVDLFELSELPDMALSNRQGYKSDDQRYMIVLDYVRDSLLPRILEMRVKFAGFTKEKKKREQYDKLAQAEMDFANAVVDFKRQTAEQTAIEVKEQDGKVNVESIKESVFKAIESNAHTLGLKPQLDQNKKKILISQSKDDKDLADAIYEMLLFNGWSAEDILYSNCDYEVSRIPEDEPIYEYLRKFFMNSFSDQRIFVVFVTSNQTGFGAHIEIGAAWITRADHKVFNVEGFTPCPPLDNTTTYVTCSMDSKTGKKYLDTVNADIFCSKIESICNYFNFLPKSRLDNLEKLKLLFDVRSN